jgi:hypothetical protein
MTTGQSTAHIRRVGTKAATAAMLIAAGGIAVATMLLNAPAAHADHSGVEVFCAGTGGRYIKDSAGVESCCYDYAIDAQGHHCRVYVGGELSGVYAVEPPSTGNPHPVPPGGVYPLNPPVNNPGNNVGGGNAPGGLQ